MRRTRVILGAIAATAALSLIPAAGAQAAVPTAVCSASSGLQLGLLGAPIPAPAPSCTTAALPCAFGTCTYRTTAVITNAISVNSGASATTVGIDGQGHVSSSRGVCGGSLVCTTSSTLTIGHPNESSGPAGAAGICGWAPGAIAVGLATHIACKIELISGGVAS